MNLSLVMILHVLKALSKFFLKLHNNIICIYVVWCSYMYMYVQLNAWSVSEIFVFVNLHVSVQAIAKNLYIANRKRTFYSKALQYIHFKLFNKTTHKRVSFVFAIMQYCITRWALYLAIYSKNIIDGILNWQFWVLYGKISMVIV